MALPAHKHQALPPLRPAESRLRIAIVTDAWHPQVNGVVNTLSHTSQHLRAMGHDVLTVTPESFTTIPCPTYPSIRIALLPGSGVRRMLDAFSPQAVHIATEGPIGQAAHRHARRRGWPFTTSFHTQFPEYIRARAPIPEAWTYAWLRRFHGQAQRTMVTTPTQRDRLLARGFRQLIIWSRGVDATVFRPEPREPYEGLPRPIMLYMGRVAIEKNIEAFLDLAGLPGSKVVVGDGPDLAKLRAQYPGVVFPGQKLGADLARHVAGADVFVFPSLTDTFGLVLLEAMACGVPIAAYPVNGPIDVVRAGVTGCLNANLEQSIRGALQCRRDACIAHARDYTWQRCTETFYQALAPFA